MRHATASLFLLCALLLAPAAEAQTEYYHATLSGANEVPAVTTAGRGVVTLTLDVAAGTFSVQGTFKDLSSNAQAAHIHTGVAGANGGVIKGLTPTTATTGTITGSGSFTAAEITALRTRGLYVNLHTVNNGGGELRAQLQQVLINGTYSSMTESRYQLLASVSSNFDSGFGDHGLTNLFGYQDGTNLYVMVVGEVESNENEAYIFINASTPTGVAAGTQLPAGSDGPSPFSSFRPTNDFQTDFGLRLTSAATSAFVSVIDYRNGGNTDTFLGTIANDGTATTVAAGSYAGAVVSYRDTGTRSANTGVEGWEFSIPLAAMGATGSDTFELFALMGNGSFISANTLPEITGQSGTNLQNNPDFNAIAGNQRTAATNLPVELTSFTGTLSGNLARLAWSTASETNNQGFYVEHSANGLAFRDVHFAPGFGTTLEAQSYTFTTAELAPGTHTFRLRQTDLDGATDFSPTVELTVSSDNAIMSVAPNPSRGLTNVSLSVPSAQQVTVSAYDVTGRRVATLFSGAADATVSATLSGVAPGVYVVVAQGETFRLTTSATVLR